MTLPTKGARTISIDGETFRWAIRRKPTYPQDCLEAPMRVVVEAEQSGAALRLVLPVNRPDAALNYDTYSVTPRDIRNWIALARDRGWTTAIAGPTFELELERTELRSEGFSS